MCVCVCVYMYVCVCVCEREHERERKGVHVCVYLVWNALYKAPARSCLLKPNNLPKQ